MTGASLVMPEGVNLVVDRLGDEDFDNLEAKLWFMFKTGSEEWVNRVATRATFEKEDAPAE